MAGLDDRRQQHLERVVAAHRDHLRARHHDVAHLQVGDAEHALEHTQRLGIDEPAALRLAQLLHEVVAVLGLAGERAAELAHPAHRAVAGVVQVVPPKAVRSPSTSR